MGLVLFVLAGNHSCLLPGLSPNPAPLILHLQDLPALSGVHPGAGAGLEAAVEQQNSLTGFDFLPPSPASPSREGEEGVSFSPLSWGAQL